MTSVVTYQAVLYDVNDRVLLCHTLFYIIAPCKTHPGSLTDNTDTIPTNEHWPIPPKPAQVASVAVPWLDSKHRTKVAHCPIRQSTRAQGIVSLAQLITTYPLFTAHHSFQPKKPVARILGPFFWPLVLPVILDGVFPPLAPALDPVPQY